MSKTYWGTRQGRIHTEDEIMNTLSCSGHNSGGSQLIQLNNNKARRQGDRVYDSEGLAVTINAAGNNNYYKINKVGSTNGGQGGNTYDPNGLAPTLCAGDLSHNGGINILEKERKINKVNEGNHQRNNVYDTDGVAPTLTATDYKGPVKIAQPVLTQDNENNRKIEKVGNIFKNGGSNGDVYSTDGISPTILTGTHGNMHKIIQREIRPVLTPNRENATDRQEGCVKIKTNTQKGYDEAYPSDGVRLDHPGGKTGRGRVHSEAVGTVTCAGNWGTVDSNYRIRKLTPLECERLQGFPDNWTKYGKDDEVISDTQRYKCCGNAVTTNVITAIVDEMFEGVDV